MRKDVSFQGKKEAGWDASKKKLMLCLAQAKQ
jgi:hypothetical protein